MLCEILSGIKLKKLQAQIRMDKTGTQATPNVTKNMEQSEVSLLQEI